MGPLRFGPLVLAVCTASAPVAAQPTVLLVDVGGAGEPASRRGALEALQQGLDREGGVEVRIHQPQRPAAIAAQIAEQIDEARRLSEQFQEADALERLARAERSWRDTPSAYDEIEPLLDLLLTRLKLQVDTGQPLDQTLERIATLDPSRTLDAGTFVPAVVERFAAIRERLLGRVVTLRIRTRPANLRVWVDGRAHGNAPVVATVVAGEHFLAAGGPQGVGGRRLAVSSATELTLHGPAAALQSVAALRALGAAENARWVVGVKVEAKGGGILLRLRAIEAQTVAVTQPLSSEVVGADEAEKAAVALVDPLAEALGLRQRAEARPVWKRWWFWTALGVLAAGGGITAGVLASRNAVRLELAR